MKILVVSDSHGNVENLCRAVERERPDMLVHLGDGWRDTEVLRRRYPELPLKQVVGNCDLRNEENAVVMLPLEGRYLMLCHGHTFRVKSGLHLLLREALSRGADIALFGHTHCPFTELREGVLLLNPGSIGSSYQPTYGTLLLEDGHCYPSLWTLAFGKNG